MASGPAGAFPVQPPHPRSRAGWEGSDRPAEDGDAALALVPSDPGGGTDEPSLLLISYQFLSPEKNKNWFLWASGHGICL